MSESESELHCPIEKGGWFQGSKLHFSLLSLIASGLVFLYSLSSKCCDHNFKILSIGAVKNYKFSRPNY